MDIEFTASCWSIFFYDINILNLDRNKPQYSDDMIKWFRFQKWFASFNSCKSIHAHGGQNTFYILSKRIQLQMYATKMSSHFLITVPYWIVKAAKAILLQPSILLDLVIGRFKTVKSWISSIILFKYQCISRRAGCERSTLYHTQF